MPLVSDNRSLRKITVAFGDLFSNFSIARYNQNGSEQERFLVPIAFAPKERYVNRLSDPNLDKKVQITLPRMSYEMKSMKYDSSRKQNTNIKNYANVGGTDLAQYMPVPWDFDFSLFIYVRNIEDGTQIVEQIMSYFTPDYTIKVNMVPEMGIVKEMPVILNSADQEIDYEGDSSSATRTVIWTLDFTIKGYVFGSINTPQRITRAITTILDENTNISMNVVNGAGVYLPGETVYQGYSVNSPVATAIVQNFANNVLTLTNVQGSFIANTTLFGAKSSAQYTISTYEQTNIKYFQSVITPNPANTVYPNAYTISVSTSEYPNVS